MKILTLIRHAKSSRDDASLADHERPLSKRGQRDLLHMSHNLSGLEEDWGALYVSSARRARETCDGLVAAGIFAGIEPQIEDACYTFDGEALMTWLRSRDEALPALTVIGHNPAIHELVNTWYDPGIPRVPTLCVLRLLSDADSWQGFTTGTVRLGAYFYPGMFRS